MVQFVQKLNGTLPAVPLNCGRALRYSWGLFSGSCWRFLGSIPSKIWAVFVRPYTGERLLDRGFTRLHCGPSVWANSIYSMDGFLVTPYNGGDVFKRIPPQKKYIYLCSGLGILWKFAQTGAKRKKKLSKKRRCEIFLAIAVFFIFRQFFIFRKLLDTICWGEGGICILICCFCPLLESKDETVHGWSDSIMIKCTKSYSTLGALLLNPLRQCLMKKGVLCQVQHYVWQASPVHFHEPNGPFVTVRSK